MEKADFYALKNVPHDRLQPVLFYSKSSSAVLRCFVYTLPDSETNRSRRYPMLYQQQGGGKNETSWSNQKFAGLIMDNLIVEGQALHYCYG